MLASTPANDQTSRRGEAQLTETCDETPRPAPADPAHQTLLLPHRTVLRPLQYLRFHKRGDEWRHPSTLGAADIEQFLTALAVQRHVSASTQNQALGALVFLYRDVLRLEVGDFAAVRARRPKRVPLVLSPAEVPALLAALDALPTTRIMSWPGSSCSPRRGCLAARAPGRGADTTSTRPPSSGP